MQLHHRYTFFPPNFPDTDAVSAFRMPPLDTIHLGFFYLLSFILSDIFIYLIFVLLCADFPLNQIFLTAFNYISGYFISAHRDRRALSLGAIL